MSKGEVLKKGGKENGEASKRREVRIQRIETTKLGEGKAYRIRMREKGLSIDKKNKIGRKKESNILSN